MSRSTRMARRRALKTLVELDLPVSEALQRLAKFPWESEHPLVTVTGFDLARVLRGFLEGTLESGDCEEWANAIESREDLGFDAEIEETLKDVVFELANPLLTRPFTPEVAAELLGRVSPTLDDEVRHVFGDRMNEMNATELAFPPEVWTVQLANGQFFEVLTHGVEVVDGWYVFSLFFKGTPLVDVPVLRIPENEIAAGQWP